MTKTLVEEYVSDPAHMRLFQQERAIFEVTKQIEDAMKEAGVTRAQLAARLGKTKSWVTQMLDGDANKTIRTVADAFAVLGLEYRSSYGRIQISNAAKVGGKAAQQEVKVRGGGSVRDVIKIRDDRRPQESFSASSEIHRTIQIQEAS
jgi:transcriptional regulator with XRE-family HTH domain